MASWFVIEFVGTIPDIEIFEVEVAYREVEVEVGDPI